jgi:hypothetical protein
MADVKTLKIIKDRSRPWNPNVSVRTPLTPDVRPMESGGMEIGGADESLPPMEQAPGLGNDGRQQPYGQSDGSYGIPTFNGDILTVGKKSPDDEPLTRPRIVTTPPYNPNAGSEVDQQRKMVTNAITAPYLAQIEANRKKIDALKTMPVTNKQGDTNSGWEIFATKDDPKGEKARKDYTDQDGRVKSGLKAFVAALASNPQLRNVRSWGDLAAGLAYAGGAGVGGAINSSWNEQQKRSQAIAQLEQQNKEIEEQAATVLKLKTDEANIETKQRTANRLDESLELRKTQSTLRQVASEKKELLAPIMKRGSYYEGDDPELDARLEAANINLPDFDTTRKPYNDTSGVRKVWDMEKREFVPAAGDEPDESLMPIPVEIDGKRLMLKPGSYAHYKGLEAGKNYQSDVDDVEDQNRYQREKVEHQDKINKMTEGVSVVNSKINAARKRQIDAQTRLTQLDPTENKSEIATLEKEVRESEGEIELNLGELDKISRGVDDLMKNPPKPPQKRPNFTSPVKSAPSSGKGRKYSDADIDRVIRQ